MLRTEEKTGEFAPEKQQVNNIICGVVEGFYGKPWSKQQRKNVYTRLRELGLNTYFYAPKDDVKHRAQWRELYTQVETDILSELIEAASSEGIDFVYALSPGIDIHYSDNADIEHIQRKFEQVRSLGCKSYALLFDDIETEMQATDREKFTSFATAQVSVTNDIFNYLGCPNFFFCPTEYCETRAAPNLKESEYLLTVGKSLTPAIHVMWTGPQVISQFLEEGHLIDVSRILRRKPLIWDNLHANDYDPKRIFLGPFAGRPVKIKELISGILLNPNCKFVANFVPLYTFGKWFHAEADAPETIDISNVILKAGDVNMTAIHAVNSANPSLNLYHPIHSLEGGIREWMLEFQKFYCPSIAELLNDARLADVEMASPKILTNFVEAVVNENEPITAMNSLKPEFAESMETASSSYERTNDNEETRNCKIEMDAMDSEERHNLNITYDQLATLIDLFFLPFNSGRRGEEILENFYWMYENAWLLSDSSLSEQEKKATQTEWLLRYETIGKHVKNIKAIFNFLANCPNKQIVAELIPYIWESHGIVCIVYGIMSWLKLGYIKKRPESQKRFWKTDRKDESWVTNGGFLNQVFKVIAGDGELHNFCTTKSMLPLSIVDFTINPLPSNNLMKLSKIATSESSRTDEQNNLNLSLFLDKYVNFYTDFDSKFVFVTEDDLIKSDRNIICSGIAVLNATELIKSANDYTIQLQEKYKNLRVDGINVNSIVDEIGGWFPRVQRYIAECFPSWLDVRFSATAYDSIPTKRMIHAMAISLSLAGSTGMFVTIPIHEVDKIDFFKSIGFIEISRTEDQLFFILARSICRTSDDELPANSTGT